MIKYLFIPIFISLSISIKAQIEQDTLQARSYMKEGIKLYTTGKYKESNELIFKATDIYEVYGIHDLHIECLGLLIQNHNNLLELDQAIKRGDKALELIAEHYPDGVKPESSVRYVLSITYREKGYLDKALEQQAPGIASAKKYLGEFSPQVANFHSIRGIILNAKGYYDEALEAYQDAIKVMDEIFEPEHLNYANAYGNIGGVYYRQGQFERSLDHYKKCLVIMRKSLGEDHPLVAMIISNLGIINQEIGAYSEALDHLQDAYEKRVKIYPEYHPEIGRVLLNIGNVYAGLENYDEAINYYHQAINLLNRNSNFDHVGILYETYYYLGELYLEQEAYDSAAYYQQIIVNESTERKGYKGSFTGGAYRILGQISYVTDKPAESLDYFQKAMMTQVDGFNDSSIYANPTLEKIVRKNQLLETLRLKANAFAKYHAVTNDLDDLMFSMATFQKGDSLVDLAKKSNLRLTDKVALGKVSSSMFVDAIGVCQELYKITSEKQYLELAFYFGEKSKASILTQRSNEDLAKHYAGVPSDLLTFERNLKADQSYYQSELQKLTADAQVDSSKLTNFQQAVFKINLDLDSVAQVLENNYPKYYQLKYSNTILTIADVQQKLDKKSSIIEIFDSPDEDLIFLFLISKDEFQIKTIKRGMPFEASLDTYLAAFDLEKNQGRFADNFEQYVTSSNQLYNQLIAPLKEELAGQERLTIIPSGKLAYVPWELFSTEDYTSAIDKDFKTLNYLMNDFNVNYGYSCSLLFGDQDRIQKKSNNEVLAFAPSYGDTSAFVGMNLSRIFRDELTPLIYNQLEVEEIQGRFEGTYLSGEAATEQSFKELVGEYNILHLAMHAFIDDEDPMQSKLIFSSEKDSIEDGMLHTYELYNMEIPAELVVLSACKTGLGRYEEGEGVMSLGHAFSYAGCPSIMVSHWSVEDKSTSELMAKFYEHVANGKPKYEALTLAKTEFLSNAVGEKTHPYFWGGFVLIGNPEPEGGSSNWTIWLLLGVMVMIGIAVSRKLPAA